MGFLVCSLVLCLEKDGKIDLTKISIDKGIFIILDDGDVIEVTWAEFDRVAGSYIFAFPVGGAGNTTRSGCRDPVHL